MTKAQFQQALDHLQAGQIPVVGVPFDAYSSYARGCAMAPPRIMQSFHSSSANYFTENLIDLEDHPTVHYIGELPLADYHDILPMAQQLLQESGGRLLGLGGDHSVSFPLVKAAAQYHEGLSILHFDAHTDLYDNFEGQPYSHASPFARIMETGLVKRLIQVGIRTLTRHTKEQADRFGVEIWQMKDRQRWPALDLQGPLYVSMDLDVLDPAYAPGISHYEPGGMSVREVLDVLQQVRAPVHGADLVEYNPTRDHDGVTGMVAAKFFKELCGLMLSA